MWAFFTSNFKERRDLALEKLALRQQLAVLKRERKRPAIKNRDRLFRVWLSRIWRGWRESLVIVRPETFIGWHRQIFRLFWTKLSRRKIGGRPDVDPKVGALIKQMTEANPLWGAPRIHAKDAPEPRAKQPPELGTVIEIAEVGRLRHRYERRAA